MQWETIRKDPIPSSPRLQAAANIQKCTPFLSDCWLLRWRPSQFFLP